MLRLVGIHLYGPKICGQCDRVLNSLRNIGIPAVKTTIDDGTHPSVETARRVRNTTADLPAPMVYLVFEDEMTGRQREMFYCVYGEFTAYRRNLKEAFDAVRAKLAPAVAS